jgi:hypothetical protein
MMVHGDVMDLDTNAGVPKLRKDPLPIPDGDYKEVIPVSLSRSSFRLHFHGHRLEGVPVSRGKTVPSPNEAL